MGQVLLVDPHPISRQMMVAALSANGDDVDAAAEGEEALRRLAADSYQFLITDLALPDRDGLDVLLQAKRIDPTMQAIAITSSQSAELIVEAVRAGACDVLFRPITPASVRLTFDRVRAVRPTLAGPHIRPLKAQSPGREHLADEVETIAVPLVRDYQMVEKHLVENAIRHFGGNKAAAAKALGMHRRTLYRVLDRRG